MKKNIFYFVFLLLIQQSVLVAQSSLEKQLFDLPDIRFKAIETPDGYEAAYQVFIKQPLDHENPSKGHFYQKMFLSHRGFDRPTVMVTEGYDRKKNYISEPADLLEANQILIEHRFFGDSKPDENKWDYLNLKQVTADLHHINQLFRTLYDHKWVSTGISKSGQTTIFYRYFYPGDVDVSMPYVAPLNQEFEDKRIYSFLKNVGTEECRNDIRAVQERLFKNREAVLSALKWFAKGKGFTFEYMGLEAAFEYGVLEYPFSFWQSGQDCSAIPSEDAPLDEVIDYYIGAVGLFLYSDAGVVGYGPHYYQAATEMGYYGFETKPFEKWLKAVGKKPHAAFVPDHLEVPFDDKLIKKLPEWLATKGNQFVYIYGGIDTWSATAVPPSDKVDALWFMMDGRHHGDARIKNMTEEERAKLMSALDRWLK